MSSIAREFSPDGKYCAYISQQGKFIVYEVETGTLHQVYTPNMHLNVPCTCFTWLEVATDQPTVATPRTGKAKKQRNSAKQLMAAFGTSRGRVAFYSLATGTIERSCQGDGHSAPVTAICFNAAADPDTLLTAGADGKVIEWSIMQSAQGTVHNIGVEKLSCVMLASSDVIVTGSKQLKLWDRTESRLLRTLVGHTSNTQILRALTATTTTTEEIESFALSGSVLDRNVSMWSLNTDGENTQPVASFALDDVPEYVSLELVERKMHLVAVSRTGVAHYFMRSLDKLSVKRPYRANHTFQIAVDTATTKTKAVDRLPVFVASVQHSPQPETIMLGYGTEASLRFEPIPIDAELKINVIIREPIKLLGKSKQEGDLKTKTPIVDANSAEYLNPVNANKKNMKKVEIPMEVRLENLSLLPDRSDTKMVTGRKNMIHLLVQGLHSRDATILRSVFGRNDPEMIQQTVERIPAQYLGALLSEMSYLMQLKTVHVQTAVCWLKQLITVHASQLMALGASNLMTNFATCLGIIEYRVEHLNSLAKLRGRLGLLIDQADRSKKQSGINRNVDENVLVYQEEDDSDVDSVLGTDNEQPGSSNEDIYDGDEQESPEYDDDDEEQENPASDAGLSVRKQNGFAQEDEEHDGNDSDDSEEMEVSD